MRRYSVSIDNRSFTIDVIETAADRFVVSVGDQTFEATLDADEDLPGTVVSPGMMPAEPGTVPSDGSRPAASQTPAVSRPASRSRRADAPRAAAGVTDVLSAPMPGVVLEVLVVAGTAIGRGDPILVLEAMKMRNTIRAPHPAVVVDVVVEAGQPVGPGDPLVRLTRSPG